MCVPSGFAWNVITLHGAIARNHIFDHAGEHVSDMRLAVGRGGAVVEGIGLVSSVGLIFLQTLFKDVILFPEF